MRPLRRKCYLCHNITPKTLHIMTTHTAYICLLILVAILLLILIAAAVPAIKQAREQQRNLTQEEREKAAEESMLHLTHSIKKALTPAPRRPLTEQEKQTRALQSIEREVRRGRVFGRKSNEWTWWLYWGNDKNK